MQAQQQMTIPRTYKCKYSGTSHLSRQYQAYGKVYGKANQYKAICRMIGGYKSKATNADLYIKWKKTWKKTNTWIQKILGHIASIP